MTPGELNQMLASQADIVAAYLLPNGKRQGNSWCAGSVHGEEGQSLRVCIQGGKAGVWSDFSDNDKGGDMLSLWQKSKGISFVETLKEVGEYLGIGDANRSLYTPRKAKKTIKKPDCHKVANNVISWFEERGIFEKALEVYKVRQQGEAIVFPFLSPENDLELVKYRNLAKEKKTGKKEIWSNKDPEYHLWGWQAIKDDDRDVVICEGESDALTWYQQGIPALSIPQGAGSGDKQIVWIENDYDRLLRFETIYISMDMDAEGQAAIPEIAQRLGQERCKIVDLGEYKDANEAHLDGILLKDFLSKAKTQDPEELGKLIDHHEDIMDEFRNSETIGCKLPWRRTKGVVRLRPSEISVWAGINSHGKSVALSHVTVDLIAQGDKVCIASMEMKPRKMGRKMYQQVSGKAELDRSDESKIVEFLGDRAWLFEVYGTAKAERIIEVFTYARKRYGINHFVVDSLAKCGFGEDDYNGQKGFVDKLMEFAGQHDVHVHLVVHIRKLGDEAKIPGKMDIKGTGAITDMVDNTFIWWRNKKKEEAVERGEFINEPDAVLNCVKQRETGEEPMIGVYFHNASCQFVDDMDSPPKQYIY